LGSDFKKEFIDKQMLLPKSFNPASVYFHTDVEQPSMIGAYAYALGAYPNHVSYLDYNNVLPSGSNLLTREKEARTALGFSTSPGSGQNTKVPLNTEEGYLYWKDPKTQCPIIFEDITSQFKTGVTTTSTATRGGRPSTTVQNLSRVSSKIMGNDDSVVEQLMAQNFGDDDKILRNFNTDFGQLDDYVYHAQARRSEPTDRTMDSVKHANFFTDQNSYRRMLSSIGVTKGNSIKTGENVRFEIFELNGKHYVRGTRAGEAINFVGGNNGVLELSQFLTSYYSKLYIGGVQDVCVGQEDVKGTVQPQCSRGSFVGTQRVVQTTQQIQAVQPVQTVQPVHSTVTRPVIKEKCHLEQHSVHVERSEETREHRVDLIKVGRVEIVQIPRAKVVVEERIVDRPVPYEVMVPVIEEKIVIHEVEKIVTEPPTHIHHIELESPDRPVGLPPIQFHEEIDEGWPWWLWLLPLLCCIPLLAWLLCRKPKPKPVVRPKQPMAPVQAKALARPREREIMEVKTEERHSPERKYVIERKVVDEGEAIEMEIEKELRKSRVVRETHASRAVSHGRQTATEIAGEGALSRTTGQGRTRRIKTIKKFGQVIGKEEQIIDADGNIISSKKIGLDDAEYASDQHMRSAAGSEYQNEARYAEDVVVPTSTQLANERKSRRGYSSGRHMDGYGNVDGVRTGGFAEGGDTVHVNRTNAVQSSSMVGSRSGGEFRSGAGSGAGLGSGNAGTYAIGTGGGLGLGAGYGSGGDDGYGRYSPGRVSRGSRGSGGGSGRHEQQQYRFDDDGDDKYYV
jgi:hypothetical protein